MIPSGKLYRIRGRSGSLPHKIREPLASERSDECEVISYSVVRHAAVRFSIPVLPSVARPLSPLLVVVTPLHPLPRAPPGGRAHGLALDS